MGIIREVVEFLQRFAPPQLAEDWDNVGLLMGDPRSTLERVMTCLTITPESAQEAIDQGVGLVVTHHPLPFKPIKRLTTERPEGALLWRLASAGVAVYSPHTAFDSARGGINQQLAQGLQLEEISPLIPFAGTPSPEVEGLGTGRRGLCRPTITRSVLGQRIKDFLKLPQVRCTGTPKQSVEWVAIACGSGGSMLEQAAKTGCDTLVTGEAQFHTCLQAEALGIGLLLVGHYASERFAVEQLAEVLQEAFPGLAIWPSQQERDPLTAL